MRLKHFSKVKQVGRITVNATDFYTSMGLLLILSLFFRSPSNPLIYNSTFNEFKRQSCLLFPGLVSCV
jgi:hypothetical protein